MNLQLMWMKHLHRIHFMIKNKPSKESLLLLNSLILGLQRMEDEQYTEFIDIIFEEV